MCLNEITLRDFAEHHSTICASSLYLNAGKFPLIIIINDNVFNHNGSVCYMLHPARIASVEADHLILQEIRLYNLFQLNQRYICVFSVSETIKMNY